jgi:UDP-N-acetylglucosamine 2-epimerase (non-hydrolysing)
MKVTTIVGTRPEIIKLSCVISELDKYMTNILVHTGQNFDYELNEIFFTELGIRKPDYFLDAVGENLATTIANILIKIDAVLDKEQPDAILMLGDTNSCLSAIIAKRKKIPIFHMEAGNRCFDQRVPEEINRKIVDHLSDINLTYTEHARRYLIQEGLKPEMIIKTGSPMKEVLLKHADKINNATILEKLDLDENNYFVVSMHREENIDNEENFNKLLETLTEIVKYFNKPIIVSTHPRTRKKLEQKNKILDSRIKFMKPLGFLDYIKLQKSAYCVISDSGTITEEASILQFPAVTIRQVHERPEGMDEGALIMCGLDYQNVINSIKIVVEQFKTSSTLFNTVHDYEQINVSHKIVRIIQSYTDYVNRVVWKK